MNADRSVVSDLQAGVVVCLVALPLCLGIALASGAPLAAGLITGIIGGLVVSWLGGTQLLVSGPAAGLATLVLASIAELGSFRAVLAATVVAGLFQIGLGLARLGRLARLVPSVVVVGMLAGIGVLLFVQQLPHALGAVPERGLHGLELVAASVRSVARAAPATVAVAGAALAVLVAWTYPRAAKLRGYLPGPVAALIVGIAVAELVGLGGASVARVELPALSGWVLLPDLASLADGATWRVALTLGAVASLETLLSMEATDKMDPQRRQSDGDRELLAQGVGNTLAGLVGGLPMTGVIVRSAANVAAGGRTWRSSFVHGGLLAALVLGAPQLIGFVPVAALAAILLFTGWQLAHPNNLRAAVRSPGDLAVLALTVGGIVSVDLLVGVGLGIAASAVRALVRSARHGLDIDATVVGGTAHVKVELARYVSFVHKGPLAAALERAPAGSRVTVDGTRTRSFDHDVVDFLHRFAETARHRDIQLELVGVPAPAGRSASH